MKRSLPTVPHGPLLAVFALLVAAFAQPLWQGRWLIHGDALAYYHPVRLLVAESFRLGEFPHWNPINFGGVPLHGMMQAGACYPGILAYLLAPPEMAANFMVMSSYFLAAAGIYLYLRAVGCGSVAGAVGGMIFALSGHFWAHMDHPTYLHTAALWPVLFWTVERFAQCSNHRYALLGGLLITLHLTVGYPQNTAIGLVMLVAYALYRTPHLARGTRMPFWGWLTLACGLGIGAAAAPIWPGMLLISTSERFKLSFAALVDQSMPPIQLATLFFPFLFGATVNPNPLFEARYWGVGMASSEMVAYVGLGTWLLAALAFLRPGDRPVWFWLGLASFALLLALGDHTPFYKLWVSLPAFDSVRVPARYMLVFSLTMAMLAGFGFQSLQEAGRLDASRTPQGQSDKKGALWRGGRVALGGLMGLMGAVVVAIAVFGPALAARRMAFVRYIDIAAILTPSHPVVWVPLVVLTATGGAFVLATRHPRALTQAALVATLALDLLLVGQSQDWRSYIGKPPANLKPSLAALNQEVRYVAIPPGFSYNDLDQTLKLHLPSLSAAFGERHAGGAEGFINQRYSRLVGDMGQ